jgi:hypothetical protein
MEFPEEDFQQGSSRNRRFLLNLDELIFGSAEWSRNNSVKALECKVKHLLQKYGHDILWSFPTV